MEEIGPPTAAFPDDGVAQGPGLFRDGDGFGTSRRDFTSPSGGGNIMSSVGSDNGPDGQGGGGPLPTQFDELNADYSSFTPGDLFPATVITGFEYVDPLIMNNDPTLFGDSDYVGGFPVNASGLSLLGFSTLGSSADRTGKRGSGGCLSDGSSVGVGRCMEGDLSIAPSSGGAPDADYQPAQQIPNFPGSNVLFGGASPSVGRETIAGQNSFPMGWPWDMIERTFPPACCDVTPPAVDDSFAPPSDFVSPTPDLPSGQLGGGGGTVPEIPAPAMLLIGFGGLALVGWRRLRGSGAAGSAVGTR
jgi:hypothetical protein